eukprot:14413911-Alexandrium_andersonii.AAC.2
MPLSVTSGWLHSTTVPVHPCVTASKTNSAMHADTSVRACHILRVIIALLRTTKIPGEWFCLPQVSPSNSPETAG